MSAQSQEYPAGWLSRECLNCKQNILISKPADGGKWIKKELNAIDDHICKNKSTTSTTTTTSTGNNTYYSSYDQRITDQEGSNSY